MATIALYANKINQMPGLIKDVKKSVTDYKSELSALKKKALTVDKSVCNLDDVISSIQTSSQTQEEKVNSLDTFNQNSENFISDVIRIDSGVANLVRQRKDDFYESYSYLKPECEKDWKEKTKDWFVSAGEWCKEHWKAIVTIVLVIAAVAIIVLCPASAGLILAIAKGILFGAAIGGVAGGVINAITGGSFWEGFENGAFMGAIAGIISGGMGFAFTGGVQGVSLTLGQTLSVGGASGAVSQLISDLGDTFIKGTDISFGQVLLNMGISGTLGVAFAGIGYGLSKGFTALKLKFFSKPGVTLRSGFDELGNTVEYVSDYCHGADAGIERGFGGPKLYSVKNSNGADIYVSTDKIVQSEFASIIDNATGDINLLTGAHGDMSGNLSVHEQFFIDDLAKWGNNPNVKVFDVTKLSPEDLSTILNGKNPTVCGGCFSERSIDILNVIRQWFN